MKTGRVAAFLGAGLLAASLLGACGQRGPLVLPKPPEPPPEPPCSVVNAAVPYAPPPPPALALPVPPLVPVDP